MKIVLDANILYRNWYLDGPDFRVLEKHIALGRCELVVPEIVVLETVNNYRREVAKLSTSVRKLCRLVRGAGEALSPPDVEEACETYQQSLWARLQELKARTDAHADVPHDVLVERALKIRKPFRESDKGYRDCLLWEVIVRKVVTSEDKTFLVSDNRRDFGGERRERSLHSDLRADLARARLPEDCVMLYPSLREFVHEVIAPDLETAMDEVAESLRDGTYAGFSLLTWFTRNRSDLATSSSEWVGGIATFIPELESAEVTNVDPPGSEHMSIDNIVRIDDERLVLYATADVDLTVDGFVFKADYYALGANCPLQIMDDDWNNHYMWAQLETRLPLGFSVTLNVITNEVEDYKVDPIGEIFGWCQRCGQLILSDAAEACRHCGSPFF